MDLNAIKKKLKGLSLREKLIAGITTAIVVFIVPYMFLYEPSKKAVGIKRQSFESILKDVTTLDTVIKAQPPEVPQAMPVTLPKADTFHEMFLAISRQANALGVDFISISPEVVRQKDRFIEMRLKLELRVKYRQLYDFVRYLGEKHRLLLIESIRFETNDAVYPQGIALIKALTYLEKT
ncbi:MAG: type 4a pilus biogenesis protein PilO [Nitrospirae bacterium]|nr:type 4a pilus biogenesis protein PilO [Nitrospirota bacterium]